MTDCIIEWKDFLFALITPIVTWVVREVMGRTSPDSVDDFIEGILAGIGVIMVIYLIACSQ